MSEDLHHLVRRRFDKKNRSRTNMANLEYIPADAFERKYFEYLWDVANNRTPGTGDAFNNSQGELSGLAAVTFFQRSRLDKGFLKQIWTLSTPAATMNQPQFFVALRFIAMMQNGEIPISKGDDHEIIVDVVD